MKKLLLLSALFLSVSFSSFAQNIVSPKVERSDSMNSYISKIETNKLYTIVTFEYVADKANSWVQLDKEIFIRTPNDKHYDLVKAEGIGMSPNKITFENAGDKLSFKAFFKKIPATTKTIDIIENDGNAEPGHNYFNYYGVSLTKSVPHKTIVTAVNLSPPPALDETFNGNRMTGIMNSMGPMFSNMAKSLMDAQLDYYKQPGKLVEIAKLNKQYFDALVKEGFTEEQALKIITSDSMLPKASIGK